jgi:hypothetical protein
MRKAILIYQPKSIKLWSCDMSFEMMEGCFVISITGFNMPNTVNYDHQDE